MGFKSVTYGKKEKEQKEKVRPLLPHHDRGKHAQWLQQESLRQSFAREQCETSARTVKGVTCLQKHVHQYNLVCGISVAPQTAQNSEKTLM